MDFNEENLRSALSGVIGSGEIYYFPEVESTNALAFRLAEEGAAEGAAVIADAQTGGRGRLKRKWLSPPGVNIYLSLILRPETSPAMSAPVTIMAGVAAAVLLSTYCPGMVRLKWPNDVLINGKKACGILAEIKAAGNGTEFIVLGIGLNVNMKKQDFPSDLRERATSLREETGREWSRLSVASGLFGEVEKFYRIFLEKGFAGIRDSWLRYSMIVGEHVEVDCGGEAVRGKVAGIDDAGALILCDATGRERRVIAGDALPMQVKACF